MKRAVLVVVLVGSVAGAQDRPVAPAVIVPKQQVAASSFAEVGVRVGVPPFGTGRYKSRFYEASILEQPTAGPLTGVAGATGIRGLRLTETSGILSSLLIKLISVFGVAASATKVESHVTSTDTARFADGSTITSTTTTTTWTQVKSDAQVRSEIDAIQNSDFGGATMAVELYIPQLPALDGSKGQAYGYRFELGVPILWAEAPLATEALPWVTEFGISFGYMSIPAGQLPTPPIDDRGEPAKFQSYTDTSIYGRLIVPLTGWVEVHALLSLNSWTIIGALSPNPAERRNSLFSLGATVNLTDRVFARANGNLGLFEGWHLWYGLEAGVRL